jgi:hypothetical protein
MIYCEIFSMTDQKKIFLWKYFKFIRLSIKIELRLIVDHFFCDRCLIKKVKYCYLNIRNLELKKRKFLFKINIIELNC